MSIGHESIEMPVGAWTPGTIYNVGSQVRMKNGTFLGGNTCECLDLPSVNTAHLIC